MKIWMTIAVTGLFVLTAGEVGAQTATPVVTGYIDNAYKGGTTGDFTGYVEYARNGKVVESAEIYAGRFDAKWDVTNTARNPGFPAASFDVYCVDLDHYDMSLNKVDVYAVNTQSDNILKQTDKSVINARLEQVAWLYQNYDVVAKTSDIAGAALQLAIWNVLESNNTTIGTTFVSTGTAATEGNFFRAYGFGNGVINQANTYLTNLKASNWAQSTGAYLKVTPYSRDVLKVNGQDMFGPALVPEGQSLALLAFGGLPLLGLVRRKVLKG